MIEIPKPLRIGRRLRGAAVHAAARLADALDVPDDAFAVGAVFQFERNWGTGSASTSSPVPDIAFALEHFGQAALHLRDRHRRRWAVRRAPRCGCESTYRRWDRSSCVVWCPFKNSFTPVLRPRVAARPTRALPPTLPARFSDARNQALVGQLPEADPANAELAIHRPRPAAILQRRFSGVENFGFCRAFAIFDLLAMRFLSV